MAQKNKSVSSKNGGKKEVMGVAKKGVALKPLLDRVLISETEEGSSERTASGIFLPTTGDKESTIHRGVVVAVGPGKTENGHHVTLGVKVGDTVLFQWGEKIKIDGVEYFLVRESDIACVVA